MQIYSQVGPQATIKSLADGTFPPIRSGNLGDVIVSELHGRYYEQAYRRNIFTAANQAGQVTTVGTAATYTGICLSNSIGNTVNLVLLKVGYSFLVAFAAAAAVGIMTGFNGATAVTHSTPLTAKSHFIGVGAGGQGLVDSSCVMPTAPTVDTIFDTGLTGAITTVPDVAGSIVDFEGSIVIPPGGYAALFTSTASGAASLWGSMMWEEVPV